MGVYIKGMDMPESCWGCLSDELNIGIAWHGAKCPFCERILTWDEFNAHTGRHPDCPLVEVKEPHGRLIDADALPVKDLDSNGWINAFGVAVEDLENALTVIEAEGDEKEREHES